ncbi:MAG: ABC transporter substrate-binding protein [Chloroflexota bacterium]
MTACITNQNADDCQPPECIIYGLTLNVSGIDPHINRSTELGIVLRNVYDTLVYRHPETNEFVPGLATAWTVSDDGLVYDFTLRQGVTFHDGTPFNADAVATNFARIFDDNTASQRSRFLLGPISSYQVIDEFTFRITLSQAFQPLLDSLSQVYLGIASPTALAEFEGDQLRYQFHQSGTGPFRFVEYLTDDYIIIERNPNYTWGPDFYDTAGNVQRIEYRFFLDEATRLLALENGDAHIMGELPPLDARAITTDTNLTLYPVDIPGQPLQFYMNTQQAPTDERAVREALIYGLNRAAIVDAVFGGFSPVAWGPITEATDFYNSGVVNVYATNLTQARQLLADAGYEDTDGDNILDRDDEPLEISLVQPPWGSVPQVVQFMQDQWRGLGIQVDIEPVPGERALLEATAEGDYNLVAFGQSGLDPYLLNQAFLSDAEDNWTGYENIELDSILLQAAQEPDLSARRLLYGQAQATIMQDALIIPVRDYVNLNAAVSEISGLVYDAYGWFPLMYGVSYQS